MVENLAWRGNMTAQEKVSIYRAVLAILEKPGRIDFDRFVRCVCQRVDFLNDGDCSAVIQEMLDRGYLRLNLRGIRFSNIGFVSLIDVVRM